MHRIEWLVEGRVLLVTWSGVLRQDEIQDVDEKVLHLLRAHPDNQVHVMTDFTSLTVPPSLLTFRNSKSPAEPNYGWALSYGYITPLVRTILAFLGTLFRIRYRTFKTREEAIRFLETVDKTLPRIGAGC